MLHFWVERICAILWEWYRRETRIRIIKSSRRNKIDKSKHVYIKAKRQPGRRK